MTDVTEWSARTLAQRIAGGELSAVAVCRAYLDRIRSIDPALHAFRTVDERRALDRARRLDADRGRGRPTGPLHGVPIALKDNLSTRGMLTTASSRILAGFVPPYDATAVTRLDRAGAIIIGKTNLDEFAMGSSTENSAFGPSRNPWALDRAPGGSSGGSAVAVAAQLVPLALGSDTGGSIRQPAALCGVTGLKPTYGRVSRYGLLAFASSLDQIGPLARSADDAALLFQAIAGPDPHDATTASEPVPDFGAALTTELYYLVATAEASSNLARYDGVRYGFRASAGKADTLAAMYDRTRDEGFGAEVKRRIMLGTYVLSAGYYDAYYLKAQRVRTLIRRDYDRAFARVDVVAMPTSPTPAFRLGEKTSDPLQMYLADIFTVSANLAGLPAISVPCGFSGDNLPIGLQLTGRPFDEGTLLSAANAYQRETTWHRATPNLAP
ncbi:MAG: aspartyl/glutamyl-tRNA amidotransferase subunit A [Acidobacteria bacterium]|nr:aspartyl/glutamyl-tRNA amidotransferase subunit A [Acidobacteriota bacterium]